MSLKEAPLRRDVRSLGTLLGEVLREQAGEELFAQVEALRQGTIRRRDAEARGEEDEAARQARAALELVHSLPVERAIAADPRFCVLFRADQSGGDQSPQAAADRAAVERARRGGSAVRWLGTLREMRRVGISADEALEWLKRVLIVPVFTAHPTEVARRSVMLKRRRIGEFLAAMDRIPVPAQDLARLEEADARGDYQPVADGRGALAQADGI